VRGTPGCGSVHGLRLFSHPAHYLFSMESPIAADSEARNLALLVVQLNPFFVTLACKRWRWFGGHGVAPAARREGFCLRYERVFASAIPSEQKGFELEARPHQIPLSARSFSGNLGEPRCRRICSPMIRPNVLTMAETVPRQHKLNRWVIEKERFFDSF
jgi:hypothetical protein